MTCGYHANQQPLAPKGYLTGAEWNWAKVYTDFVTAFQSGRTIPNLVRGGLDAGIVKPSAYGPLVGADARKHADDVKAKMLADEFDIFAGGAAGLKDNKGTVVIPPGKVIKQTDVELERMNYLVEGVIGSA